MITVSIFINGTAVVTRSARNITLTVKPDADECHYAVDDGRIITHKRSDGPNVLATKMLQGVVNIDEQPPAKPPLWARIAATFIPKQRMGTTR